MQIAEHSVQAVARSQERQEASTKECNARIVEKEEERAAVRGARGSSHTSVSPRKRGNAASESTPHPHEPEPPVDLEWLYGNSEFYDDVKGGGLDRSLTIQARQLEMQFFRRMGVYSKIHRSMMPKGSRVITTRWVDTNKGSEQEPNVRSRRICSRRPLHWSRSDMSSAYVPVPRARPGHTGSSQ